MTDGFSFACGCAVPSHYTDFYSFTGSLGDILTVRMTSTNFSTFMFLMNTNCQSIAITNEALNLNDTQFRVTLPSNGTYLVEATSADIFKTGPYTLSVTCGAGPSAPDIAVLVSNTNLPNYGLVDLGITTNGTPRSIGITITNKGSATLSITSASFYYGLSNVFSITPSPVTNLAAGAAAGFTLQFVTSTNGQYQDALILANNDPDENPFVINLTAISNPNGTPPTVTVTAPTNNSKYIAPATITVSASATAFGTGVTITNVVFLYRTTLGTFLIGNDTSAPYSVDWLASSPGNYGLLAVAYDSQGRAAISTNTVNVEVDASTQNRPPVANNDNPVVAANSVNNIFQVLTNDFDPDGDPLTVINVTPPQYGTAGIVDGGKAVRYTPKAFTQGTDGFSYDVSDGHGGVARGRVWITIEAGPIPSVTITNPPDGATVYAGTTTNIMVDLSPLQNIVKVEYFVGSDRIGVVTNAPFNVFPWFVRADQCFCGLHAEATDKYGQVGSSAPVHYDIQVPPGSALPVAAIDSPAAGTYTLYGSAQTHSVIVQDGILVVTGSVYQVQGATTNAAEYKVLIKTPEGTIVRDSGWLPAALIRSSVINTNDLTTLRNDDYDLELLVRNDYVTTNAVVRFALDSNLKIGPFTYSEQDTVIPVSGMPLAVVRTYDSMNLRAGDFGYSWSYALNEMDLNIHEIRVNRHPLFDDEEGPGPGGTFSMRVGGSRDVTLTLPDGRRTTFYYYEVPGDCSGDDGVDLCAEPRYFSPPGVNATLRPVNKFGGDLGGYDFFTKTWKAAGGETAHETFDFPGFILTTQDGTQYYLKRDYQGDFTFLPDDVSNEDDGFEDITSPANFFVAAYGKARLAEIRQPSGNRIVINPDTPGTDGRNHFSVDHLDPTGHQTRSIFFQRDDRNRIAAIMDPISGSSGLPVVKYEYDDSANNLVRVLRLQNRATQSYATNTYLYENSKFPHFLTKILDARGLPVARNLYDDDGKLIGVIDAQGRTNRLVHNVSGRTETIYDRLGNQTTHVYDAHGNVTVTVDALGQVWQRSYDANDNLTSVTDALTNTIFYGYDANGNCNQVVDAAGRTNSFVYDPNNGNLLLRTDPLGNVVENRYDQFGNLTNVIEFNPQGGIVAQSFSVYNQGRLVETRDANYNLTGSFGYDDQNNVTNITDATGFSRAMQYDANGRQTSSSFTWTGPGGTPVKVASTNEYDAEGRVTRMINPLGYTNYTVFSDEGKVQYTIDVFGNTNRFLYDARGNLIETTYPNGSVIRTVYDEAARPVLTTDRNFPTNTFNATHNDYDAVGRVTNAVRLANVQVSIVSDPDNPGQSNSVITAPGTVLFASQTEFMANGWVKARISPTGRRTTQEYWPDGQIMSMTDSDTNRTFFVYDEAGRRSLTWDALNRPTRFEYDEFGHQARTVFADGSSISNSFDNLGRQIAQVDQAGRVTKFDYTIGGQLKSVTKPPIPDPEHGNVLTNPVASYTYDPYGRLSVITDPKGRTNTFTYDAYGRQLTHRLPMGQTETNEYNSKGQLWRQYDFKGQRIEFIYDKYSRVQAEFFFNAGSQYPSNAVCYQYNQFGQLQKIVQRSGVDASTNACDSYFSLVGPPGGGGNTASIGVMARMAGIIEKCKPALWLALTVAALSLIPRRLWQLLAAFYLRGGWLLRVFDSRAGRRRSRELRPRAFRWRWVTVMTLVALIGNDPIWDGLWMARAQCTLPANASTSTTRITEFAYDLNGRLIQVNSPEGVLNYGYDAATGKHTSTCTTNSLVQYGYDDLGRLKTVTVARRNGVTLTNQEVTAYFYNAVGLRSAMVLPNGVVTAYSYDSLNRLTNLTHQAGTTNLASYTYRLDITGRRTNALEILRLEDDTYLTNTLSWQYDSMYRLTNEVSALSSPSGSYSTAYSYDIAGNRLKKTRAAGTTETTDYSYDNNDQLLQEVSSINGTSLYSYDANGSLTNKTAGASVTSYTYNLANKLASIAANGINVAAYEYNDRGARVRATTSSTKYFLVDENNLTGYAQVLEELNAPGAPATMSYVAGDDVLAQCGPATNTPVFLLYDGHGSTRQLANANGRVTSRYNYDAYGLTLGTSSTPPEASPTSLLYCGEQYDSSLQMYNLRARYYNPSNGRFNQRDPFGGDFSTPQSLHKYAYAHGDPINESDPSGMFTGTLGELMMVSCATMVLQAARVHVALVGWRVAKRLEAFLFLNGTPTGNPMTIGNWQDPISKGLTDALVAIDHFFNPPGGPGFWEGLIPVWGAGRTAAAHWQNGDYFAAATFGVLAIIDAITLGTAGNALRNLARGGTRVAAEAVAEEAVEVGTRTLAQQAGDLGERRVAEMLADSGCTGILSIKNASENGFDIVCRASDGHWLIVEVKSSRDAAALARRTIPANQRILDEMMGRILDDAANARGRYSTIDASGQSLARELQADWMANPRGVSGAIAGYDISADQIFIQRWAREYD